MADDPLLSDLCSICNRSPPRYRCPRDRIRTCSLPCYKRHQQWAQCSGKRDPAAYVKRSELATPAGIDHDYNFLTGIERSLQRADEDRARRGLDDKAAGAAQSRLQRYLQTSRIMVDRAPVGMSRQKSNNTRVTKSGRVSWTVEWLHEDESRELRDAEADMTLANLYTRQTQERSKKRKRKESEHRQSPRASPKSTERPGSAGGPPTQPTVDATHTQPSTSADPQTSARCSTSAEEATPETATAHSFYLLKPRTPSSHPRVLIPLAPTSTLTEALASQVVLEFPTVKVLSSRTPDQPLPDGYMLEDDYIRQSQKDARELDALIGPGGQIMAVAKAGRGGDGDDGGKGGQGDAPEPADVDGKKLLEVLTRDVTSRR